MPKFRKISSAQILAALITTLFFSIIIANILGGNKPAPSEFKTLNITRTPITFSPKTDNPFIHTKGQKIVIGLTQRPIQLRGINFNNRFWENKPWKIIYSEHHQLTDYKNVKEIGFNTIRFAMNYDTVNSEDGWHWLIENIDAAIEEDLFVILDMHLPPGGYQAGTNEGKRLWTDRKNQIKLIEIWKKIANKYKDEKQIAAYDLLNEPTPVKEKQWEELANELIDEIRKIDDKHLILIQKTYDDRHHLPFVNDNNVAYDIHLYSPVYYTHRGTDHNTTNDKERYKYYENDDTPDDRTFEKKYLENKLNKYLRISKTRNIPLNIGEFGVAKASQTDKRGGLRYLEDLISLFEKHHLSYQLWDYHSSHFGLYNGDDYPSEKNKNEELIKLLEKLL